MRHNGRMFEVEVEAISTNGEIVQRTNSTIVTNMTKVRVYSLIFSEFTNQITIFSVSNHQTVLYNLVATADLKWYEACKKKWEYHNSGILQNSLCWQYLSHLSIHLSLHKFILRYRLTQVLTMTSYNEIDIK